MPCSCSYLKPEVRLVMRLQWASMAVTRLRPRRARCEPLCSGRNPLRDIKLWGFLDSRFAAASTILSAKKEWSDELAPTGRKRYPHWSRLMSLEELYGIPKGDYIDKKAGLAGEEDAAKIKQLKMDYDNRRKKIFIETKLFAHSSNVGLSMSVFGIPAVLVLRFFEGDHSPSRSWAFIPAL
ncbi:hypothetical protein Y032_0444g1562 [Ancylostoma ceylanicum]|uniref:Uncharacterized protein n=2 Tax=Ancylostoma ceylanicum TaxID=53326 RepID=A0A016WZC9_9BILA|nr:hypothetical protein Y032_0444g1562 [Ancylostoma ceylanicum]